MPMFPFPSQNHSNIKIGMKLSTGNKMLWSREVNFNDNLEAFPRTNSPVGRLAVDSQLTASQRSLIKESVETNVYLHGDLDIPNIME